jgi:hypothetical protein
LLLEGVAPVKSGYEDVSGPADPGDGCGCTEDGPDGIADLTLKFDVQELVAAIGPVARGDVKTLSITGELLDGTPFEAADCVVIVGKQQPVPWAAR